MAEKERDNFWEWVAIPFNDEDREFEFVNPVELSERFIEATGIAANYGQITEQWTNELNRLDRERSDIARQIAALRRKILAENYAGITKSAGAEIQDAFVLKCAREMGLEDQLLALEKKHEEVQVKIDTLSARLELLRHRLKVLEKSMDWAREYLNFQKLDMRLEAQGRGL